MVAGLAKYSTYCAGCHTANVKNNVFNVTNASTVGGLEAALASIGAMKGLASALTAQDRLDIAAYISSAR